MDQSPLITKKRLSYFLLFFMLSGLITIIIVVKQAQTFKQHASESTTQPTTRPVLGTLYDGDPRGQDSIRQHFNSLTLLVYMANTQPNRGQFDFTSPVQPQDEIVAFAEQNHLLIHGHTLIYEYIQPTWLTDGYANGSISAADVRSIMETQIKTVVGRYKGKVYSWDVVNEPFDWDGSYRPSVWYKALGPDYINQALQWAHEADPQAKLYINSQVDLVAGGSDALYNLARSLKQEGVPLDGIGSQGHFGYFGPVPSVGDVRNNLRRFEDLGLDVAFSEFDIFIKSPLSQSSFDTQAQQYRSFAQLCKDEPRCVRFTTWGVSDKDTWYKATGATNDPASNGAPLLFDTNYQPKPALFAVQNVLNIPSPLPQEPTPTSTPQPSATPVPTNVPPPSATPTHAPAATPTTRIPSNTPTPLPPLPTPTPVVVVPGKTYLSLSVFLHGIGTSGDSQSPTGGGNPTPLHPTRESKVEIYSLSGNKLGEKNISLSYKKATGNFQAMVLLDDTLTQGTYTIKIKTNQYLRKGQIVTLQTGVINTVSPLTLIAGDINNDNILDLLDYNILRGCLSLLEPAQNCSGNAQLASDLTDDGKVEVADRTLFIRELTNVQGD